MEALSSRAPTCGDCKLMFRSIPELKSHERKRICCSSQSVNIETSAKSDGHLVADVMSSKKNSLFNLICPHCKRQFTRRNNLFRHIRNKKCQKKTAYVGSLECPNCKRVFANKYNLKFHVIKRLCLKKAKSSDKVKNPDPKHSTDMKCKRCARVFTRRTNLLSHIHFKKCLKKPEPKKDPGTSLQCSNCNQTFVNEHNFSLHISKRICIKTTESSNEQSVLPYELKLVVDKTCMITNNIDVVDGLANSTIDTLRFIEYYANNEAALPNIELQSDEQDTKDYPADFINVVSRIDELNCDTVADPVNKLGNMSTSKEKYEESSEKNGEFDLPQNILEQYDSDQQVQLIRGYRILQVLKYYPNNEPFFGKPENVIRGSKHYYDVIKSPMYLNEMKRKFFNAEYNSLVEVIKDMRLIFENCYYFWGPKSVVTDQCLQMERLMESQMIQLPKDLKSMCTLEETHGKNEDDVVMKVWNRCRNKGKSCSRLMLRTWRKRRMSETKEYSSQSDLSKFCKNSKQIMKWERDVLFLPDILSFISSSLELPQIGLFFQLVQNEFDLTSICQTEVERIVIMPQYSSSFREIFSALLSESHLKNLLSYNEITEKIKHLVTEWFELLKEYDDDTIEVSNKTGLQKNFFDFVGTDNPFMENEKYENLPYCKKVIILKSVCDNLAHTQSRLKEILADADESKYSPRKIGKDKYGYTYLFFPTFLDFRLYKQKIKDDGNSSKDSSHDEIEDPKDYRTAGLKKFLPSASTDFEIVADSTEGIRCHIDELFYADVENPKKDSKNMNTDIIEALQELEWEINSKESEYIRWNNETRVKLFNEWRENCESSEPILEDETAYNNLQRDLQNETEAMEAARAAEVANHSEGDREEDRDSDGQGNEAEDEHEDDNSNEGQDHSEEKEATNKTSNDSVTDTFTEVDSFIKSEPSEIDEKNVLGYEVTPDIKEEVHSDSHSESSVGARRRRSSVPSYSFNEDYFSDGNEFESPPEDEFSSSSDDDDDSDEEWEIPSKRARTRRGGRGGSSNAASAVERPRRKCRQTSSNPASTKSEDDSEPSSTTAADDSGGPFAREEEPDATTVKSEPLEGDERSAAASSASKEGDATPVPKPTPKLKVIDLAKLKGADTPSSNVALRKPPDANAFMIQTMPTLNSLPMIRACMAQRMNSAAATMQPQPSMMVRPANLMGSAAYVVPRPNTFVMASFRRPATPLHTPIAACGPQPSALRSVAPANYGGVSNASMIRQALVAKQMVRVPAVNSGVSMASLPIQPIPAVRPPVMMMRKPSPTYNGTNYRRIAPMSKVLLSPNNVTNQGMMMVKPMMQRRPSVREIEGTIGLHSDNGHMQFVVNLANGSHVPLSNEQVQKLRDGNRGVLPQKLKIPVPADVAEKIEPCVVLDD